MYIQYIVHRVYCTYSILCIQCDVRSVYCAYSIVSYVQYTVCTIYCKSSVARRLSGWYSQLTPEHACSLHVQKVRVMSHIADGNSRPLHPCLWDWRCPLRQLLSSLGCRTVTTWRLQFPPERWRLSPTYTASQARRLLQGSWSWRWQ